MERKKRSKGRGWESCYVKKIYGMFGVEMRAYGQKLVKFCTQTHRRASFSSIDRRLLAYLVPVLFVRSVIQVVIGRARDLSAFFVTFF